MLLECCRLPVERHRSLIHFDALIRLGCFSCNRTVLIKYIAHAQVLPRCMKPPQRAGKVSILKDIFAFKYPGIAFLLCSRLAKFACN